MLMGRPRPAIVYLPNDEGGEPSRIKFGLFGVPGYDSVDAESGPGGGRPRDVD